MIINNSTLEFLDITIDEFNQINQYYPLDIEAWQLQLAYTAIKKNWTLELIFKMIFLVGVLAGYKLAKKLE